MGMSAPVLCGVRRLAAAFRTEWVIVPNRLMLDSYAGAEESGSKLPHSQIASDPRPDCNSKWCIAAASGKRPAAARGLLFAAYGGADEILDGVGRGIVPLFGERAAARPTGERGSRVGDGFLGVAHQHGRSRIGEIGIGFQIP